ncbi:MAG: hypothetical protein QG635_1698 [Bacteroidota bacterium]|nr:hypothetical protein [Bacteroidota bacterium]
MSKKILVIDDDADIVAYMNALLTDNGFEVITASNGKEGFDKAKSEQPDLICLDITMPEESGVRAYRNFYETDGTKNIPVIIITGITTEFRNFINTRKQVPPPAAYFEKPFDNKELIKKINELLKI